MAPAAMETMDSVSIFKHEFRRIKLKNIFARKRFGKRSKRLVSNEFNEFFKQVEAKVTREAIPDTIKAIAVALLATLETISEIGGIDLGLCHMPSFLYFYHLDLSATNTFSIRRYFDSKF